MYIIIAKINILLIQETKLAKVKNKAQQQQLLKHKVYTWMLSLHCLAISDYVYTHTGDWVSRGQGQSSNPGIESVLCHFVDSF